MISRREIISSSREFSSLSSASANCLLGASTSDLRQSSDAKLAKARHKQESRGTKHLQAASEQFKAQLASKLAGNRQLPQQTRESRAKSNNANSTSKQTATANSTPKQRTSNLCHQMRDFSASDSSLTCSSSSLLSNSSLTSVSSSGASNYFKAPSAGAVSKNLDGKSSNANSSSSQSQEARLSRQLSADKPPKQQATAKAAQQRAFVEQNFDPYSVYGEDYDDDDDVWYSQPKLFEVSSAFANWRPFNAALTSKTLEARCLNLCRPSDCAESDLLRKLRLISRLISRQCLSTVRHFLTLSQSAQCGARRRHAQRHLQERNACTGQLSTKRLCLVG